MQFALNTEYEGAKIMVRYDIGSKAELHINGRLREAIASDQAEITLKLGSSVQTGYEYHEFIEALVRFDTTSIEVTLVASGVSIANERQSLLKSTSGSAA